MTKRKSTKSALLSSALALFLCFTMLLGTTYAWFTDSVTSANNIIKSGNLDMKLSYKPYGAQNTEWTEVTESTVLFGKDALYEPGYTEAVWLKVENLGSLAFRYNLAINVASEKQGTNKAGDKFSLSDYLEVKYMTATSTDMESNYYTTRESLDSFNFGGVANSGVASLSDDIAVIKNGVAFSKDDSTNGAYSSAYVLVVISMPTTVGNKANHNGKDIPQIDFSLTAVATQLAYEKDSFGPDYDANAEYPVISNPVDTWDGTADTSWYNETDTEFALSTAEQFAGLAVLVDSGNNFAGKTIALTSDVDLYFLPAGATEPLAFDPIGDKVPFAGTFDGQGHTISNLYQSGWAFGYEWGKYGSIGLFGELESATVKNVTISGADACIEGGDIGGITGSATGTCVFENITIKDSDFGTYNNGIGGIIGWSGAGDYTFKNITIAEDVVLGGLWGSFDSSIGGIVGQGEPGASYNFEDVDVACRLDAYNDVTAAYKYYLYRMTGMLIGRLEETTTINNSNYPDMSKYNITCKDVTVTYGDWVDYHYCVVAGKTAWRVEPGYAYGGIPADHDHSTCAMHCNLLLTFEGLFGGAQYGVKPLTEYDGVTVVYPN
ncbi:MAG: hypothetical protein IKC26_00440 [Clostridia bacterium]|nr:hypothetical protein [Clostridia bacterium]